MFDAKELRLQPFFEKTANEMYGGDASKFLDWSEAWGGEYTNADVNAAFRAFIEGYRLAMSNPELLGRYPVDTNSGDRLREYEIWNMGEGAER